MDVREVRRSAVLVVACLGALAAPSVASASAVSLWHMDETSGGTMHDSVGANDGSLSNVGLGQPGLAGPAYGFDGARSVATVPSNASLNPAGSPFWMTAHVKFTGTPSAAIGGDYDVVRKGLSSTSGGFYKMELMPASGGVRAHCSMEGSLTSKSLTAGPDLRDGRWHTVQCAKDDSSLSVIVDGRTWSTTVSLGSFANAAPLAIGAKAEGGDWYDGLLDEVSFGTGDPVDLLPPRSTAPPAVTGIAAQGSALTATTGAWTGTQPITYAYRWQRCDAAGDCGDLPTATAATYDPVAADVGSALRVLVTASNAAGTGTAAAAATSVVTSAGPGLSRPPPASAGAASDSAADRASVPACSVALPRSPTRARRLPTGGTVTLRFDARTATATLLAPRHGVRRVTLTLDGRRLRSARRGGFHLVLRPAKLGDGVHVLRAVVHPRRGRARTLRLRLRLSGC